MRVFIPSSGSREHALAARFRVDGHQVFTDPGANPGLASVATVLSGVNGSDPQSLVHLAEHEMFDLTMIGGETLLGKQIVNLFRARGLPIVGPAYEAARLTELSKWDCCRMLKDACVPIPKTWFCKDLDAVVRQLKRMERAVVKPDGETLGKGVFVMHSADERQAAIDHVSKFPGRYLVQELIVGDEISYFVATNGLTLRELGSAQDHKQLYLPNGPMTGGMGGFAPHPLVTQGLSDRIMGEVAEPTVYYMQRRMRVPYTGVLYFQLMLTADGKLYVIEINCRFGAPEAELLMPLYDGDLAELLRCTQLHEHLNGAQKLKVRTDSVTVGVVLAAAGYPGDVRKGDPINLTDISAEEHHLYQAGTAIKDGRLVTAGGRVGTVVTRRPKYATAREAAYNVADSIYFAGKQVRRDIAQHLS